MAVPTRWMSTLACLYIMIASNGSFNTFSVFSQSIRESLGFDQESINTVSFFKEFGTSLGIISGLFYNVSGARLVLFVSAILNFAGFFFTWLCMTGKFLSPQVWQVSLSMLLVGASAAFTITCALVFCVNNFSRNQGTILSLFDSTNGLAGGIFTFFHQAFFVTAPGSSFVLVLGWLPALVMVVLLLLVKDAPLPSSRQIIANDSKLMHWLLFITLILAVYLMVVSLLVDKISMHIVKLLFIIMLIVLILPIPVILSSEKSSDSELDLQLVEEEIDESVREVTSMKEGEDFTVLQAFASPEIWLIVGGTICGAGAALTINNNLGQIGLALGYNESQTNTFVAILSLCDFIGGVATGAVSDHVVAKYGTPRPLFYLLMLLLLAAGNMAIGIAFPGALFVGSVAVGVSLGGQWAVLFTIMAEIFGKQNYAVLQNVPTIAKGVGMYFLSVKLAGVLYDREARKDPYSSSFVCKGAHCYRNTFFVMAGVCLLGCLLTGLLILRTRSFYRLMSEKNEQKL